ncbi:hypothetical protein B9P99_02765 [Candidatus Marsarchaeota G1 archaeon OSP_B]|uniref:Uncharacterized protein n=1 Tax=Candidatus Marsarchaeota G1 archaeon OSP_B TaxID=1978153 RepID=A0A2R6B354_9ARCH|nr:MAG: hypothetical protein B9P99_02765 [Candidatus Marsarchaeota G1 archaeon OSP_B]
MKTESFSTYTPIKKHKKAWVKISLNGSLYVIIKQNLVSFPILQITKDFLIISVREIFKCYQLPHLQQLARVFEVKSTKTSKHQIFHYHL